MSEVLTRENAKPGTSLAAVGGLPPIKGQPAGHDLSPATAAQPPVDGAAPAVAAQPPSQVPLTLLIKPSARDRWLSSLVSQYTPEYVETICRGAMAGNLVSQWQMFDLMEQTWPRLSKNLNELKNAVIDLEWNLQPFALKGQKPTPEAQRRAKIVEFILWNMQPDVKKNENDFEDTCYDVMDAVGKGISVLEIDYAPAVQTLDFGEGPVSFLPVQATRWVHPRYYGYPNYPITKDELMLNVAEVRFANPAAEFPDGALWAEFPDDKFIVSIFKQKSGHPINANMLRLLGFWWAASNFTWEWFLNFAQIFGTPIRIANYSDKVSSETIQLVEQLLQDMGSSGYLAAPEGVKIQVLEALKSAGENPQKTLIDAADIICDILILGQTLTTTQGSRGSQSLGNIHKDVRDEKIRAVAKRVAKLLTLQLIRPICRKNFGDERFCPWLQPANNQAKDAVATATKYKTLLGIKGVRVSKQQFYEDNDLVIPEEGDDVLEGAPAAGPVNPPGAGGSGGPGSGDENDEGPVTGGARSHGEQCGCSQHAVASARLADRQLVDAALADATGIAPRWLGAVRPVFEGLIAKAKAGNVSDADLIAAIGQAQKDLPEVFHRMDHNALGRVIEDAMASAVVNGAVRGGQRKPGTRQAQEAGT